MIFINWFLWDVILNSTSKHGRYVQFIFPPKIIVLFGSGDPVDGTAKGSLPGSFSFFRQPVSSR